MKNRLNLSFVCFLTVVLSSPLSFSQTFKQDLPEIVDDAFGQNTLTNYATAGVLKWQEGLLYLEPMASIALKRPYGSKFSSLAKVDFDRVEEGPVFELRLELHSGRSCIVQIVRGKNPTHATINFLGQFKSKPYKIRTETVETTSLNGVWCFDANFGALRLQTPNGKQVLSFFDFQLDTPTKYTVRYLQSGGLQRLKVAGALTSPEQTALMSNAADTAEVITKKWKEKKFNEALELAKSNIESLRTKKNVPSELLINGYVNLGVQYLSLNQFKLAKKNLESALSLAESSWGNNHPTTAILFVNLAGIYRRIGDFDSSIELLNKSHFSRKQYLGVNSRQSLNSLNNLGVTLLDLPTQENLEKAYEILKEVVAKRGELLGKQHSEYLTALNNLGQVCIGLNRFDEALEILNEHRSTSTPNFNVLNGLGQIHLAKGLNNKAVSFLNDSKELVESTYGLQHTEYAEVIEQLARAEFKIGNTNIALNLLSKAQEIYKQNMEEAFLLQSEENQIRFAIKRRETMNLALSIFFDSTAARGISEWKEELSEELINSKGLTLRRSRELQNTFANESLIADLRTTKAEIVRHIRKQFRMKPQAWKEKLIELTKKRNSLFVRLSDKRQNTAEGLSSGSSVEEIQKNLKHNQCVLSLILYQHSNIPSRRANDKIEKVAVNVVTSRDIHLIKLMDADRLNRLVNTWRKCVRIDDPVAKEKLKKCNKQLCEQVWNRIKGYIDESDEVFCSTDGFLGRIPIHAIRQEDGKYLIEEFTFIDVPVMIDLPRLLNKGKVQIGQGKALLVGGVNYSTTQKLATRGGEDQLLRILNSKKWPELPYSKEEVGEIKKLLLKLNGKDKNKIKELLDEEATVENFCDEAKDSQILHFAAHAYFANSDYSSYESGVTGQIALKNNRYLGNEFLAKYYSRVHPGILTGLVFSKDALRPDMVNVLTASQISSLDLSKTRLAVLSACNTGDGPEAGVEGLTGLQRAMFIAGVDTCVCSLWKVRDRWSMEFMIRFYKNLISGNTRRIDAIRNSQLEMLAENPNPNYWAAWKLSGDWK